MTSPRAYRDAITPLDATAELQRCAGAQFDSEVVAAFLRVLDERPYGYRAGEGDDFAIAHQRAEIPRGSGAPGRCSPRSRPSKPRHSWGGRGITAFVSGCSGRGVLNAITDVAGVGVGHANHDPRITSASRRWCRGSGDDHWLLPSFPSAARG